MLLAPVAGTLDALDLLSPPADAANGIVERLGSFMKSLAQQQVNELSKHANIFHGEMSEGDILITPPGFFVSYLVSEAAYGLRRSFLCQTEAAAAAMNALSRDQLWAAFATDMAKLASGEA